MAASSMWNVRRSNQTTNADGLPSVALVHSFYRSATPSGENDSVLRQYEILAGAGIHVTLLSVSTDQMMQSRTYSIRTAWDVARGLGADPTDILTSIKPDVVHVHNLFPNISERWLTAFSRQLVATLHNYRPACAAGTLSRGGEPCALCVHGSTRNSIRHRCYRDSAVASLPLAWRNRRGVLNDAVIKASTVLTVPSSWMSDTYGTMGVSSLRVVPQPTTLLDYAPRATDFQTGKWLFIGRLVAEKGVLKLLEEWPQGYRLVVLGDGPQMTHLRELACAKGAEVELCGYVEQDRLEEALRGAAGLIVPSSWREGAPGVYADALAMGVPVIGLKGNVVHELVSQDGTGFALDRLDRVELKRALDVVFANRTALSARCREVFTERYSPQAWLATIIPLYQEVAEASRL